MDAEPAMSQCLPPNMLAPPAQSSDIDRNPDVIALAIERAEAAGLRQTTFKDLDLASFSDPESF